MDSWKIALKQKDLPDPVVVFLAGAFAGVTVGPYVLRVARGTLAAKSGEFADVLVQHFTGALKPNITSVSGQQGE